MCMFLYGGIKSDISKHQSAEYEKEYCGAYYFKLCSKNDIEQALADENNYDYRITYGHCDCGTLIGDGNDNATEVSELAEHIEKLRNIRGVKCIYIAKKWYDNKIKECRTVHINDIYLPFFWRI